MRESSGDQPPADEWRDDAARLAADVGRNVADARVLAALAAVPRHLFVPEDWRHAAYQDEALPLADGQTVSQPTVVARMAELAHLSPSDRVLEVGGGSGYAAAVLAQLCEHVHAVELREALADLATRNLAAAGVTRVDVITGDGSRGLPEHAPFDAVVVSAASSREPPALLEQLAPGGRLVIPLGRRRQQLVRFVRHGQDPPRRESFEPVRFVPLIWS